MNKQATPDKTNSTTYLPFLFGDINNRRFMTALLSGVIGGAGVSAAAGLLRSYREMRKPKEDETSEDQIILTLPKAASAKPDGYTSMATAKPGERKITANGSSQFRAEGKYGTGITGRKPEKAAVKCALSGSSATPAGGGNPGTNSVGTIVANTLGMTAGGLLSYELVSRLIDNLHERRLKRKLDAAQQAYVNALSGVSKRAEAVHAVLHPVETVICRPDLEKTAAPGPIIQTLNKVTDLLPNGATNAVRYPVAAYILALLAGTGATSYITKKVLDREFPEEKLKKDINRPTRIVFRMAEGQKPQLLEGDAGAEKAASAETCAALAALLPIYQDVVEGAPNRTLETPYVKFAEAVGTDAEGLMKMARMDLGRVFMTLLQNPKALWRLLVGTRFGLDFSKQKAVGILRQHSPEAYRQLTDDALSSRFSGPGFWNAAKKTVAQGISNFGGRDWLVNHELKGSSGKEMAWDAAKKVLRPLGRSAAVAQNPMVSFQPQIKTSADNGTLLHSNYLGDAVFGGNEEPEAQKEPVEPKAVLARVRQALKARRGVTVSATDPAAQTYVRRNRAAIRKLLLRLNAQGTI